METQNRLAKYREVSKWSNPVIVAQLVAHYLGKDTPLKISTRKDKKYMVQSPEGKWIHFGQMNPPMADFTRHQDEARRERFRIRNARWARAPKWSSAWMSYFILW